MTRLKHQNLHHRLYLGSITRDPGTVRGKVETVGEKIAKKSRRQQLREELPFPPPPPPFRLSFAPTNCPCVSEDVLVVDRLTDHKQQVLLHYRLDNFVLQSYGSFKFKTSVLETSTYKPTSR